MKSKAVSYLNYIVQALYENPKRFHFLVVLTFFLPLILLFVLFEWNIELLIFLVFGYVSTFIGYHYSKGSFFNKKSPQKFRKHYRLIAENLKDIVIIHRLKDGKNEYINSTTNTILGYQQNELIGQSTIFIVHPEDRKKVENQLTNITKLDDFFFVETVRVRCKNGDFKWMELNVKTLKNENRKTAFAIFTFRDISETIELEKANKLFAEELYERYLKGGQNNAKQLIPVLNSNR